MCELVDGGETCGCDESDDGVGVPLRPAGICSPRGAVQSGHVFFPPPILPLRGNQQIPK